MNTFIQAYRKQVPNDPASDEELVLDYGSKYPLDQFPLDFQQDFKRLSGAKAVEESSMGQEFGKAIRRGFTGLEATGAGILSLASDIAGAPYAKDFWEDIYRSKVKQSAEETPASVPTIEQATTSFPAAAQYLAGKAGELIPNVGEAVALAGVGSLAAPGPGTVTGAGTGIFARGAARAALSHLITRKLSSEVRKELEDYVVGKTLEGGLSKAASSAMKEAAGIAASIPNFAALGAGGAYGELSGREGVSDEAALEAAAIAGAGSSIGAIIPARILHTLFGEQTAAQVGRTYIDRFARQVPKESLAAGGGMGAMEFFNILAEKHADPKKKDEPFTQEDLSRIMNAAVVGGGMIGAPLGAVQALRGAAGPAREPVAKTTQPPPPPGLTPSVPVEQLLSAIQSLPMRQSSKIFGEILSSLPREAYEAVAKEPPSESSPATKEQLQAIRQRLSESGEAYASAMRGLRDASPETSRRLQQASGSPVVVPDSSSLPSQPSAELAPPAAGAGLAPNYPVPPEAMDGLRQMAQRELSGATKPEDVEAYLTAHPGYRLTYQTIKAEVQNAKGKEQTPGGIPAEQRVTPVGPAEGQAETGTAQRGGTGEEGQVSPEAGAGPGVVTVPLMVTKEMEQALADLGYSKEQRDALKPEDAQAIISAQKRAPVLEEPKREEVTPSAEEIKAQEKGDEGGSVLAPEPVTPAEAPKPAGDLSETSWVEKVPESISAIRTPRAGKEAIDMFSDLGRDPKNKGRTKALGVFRSSRSGKIIVATLYDNNGKKVFIGNKGRSWERVIQGGGAETAFEPIAYIKLSEPVEKFYREYSPEQWGEVRKRLEAKRDAAKAAVGPEPTPISKGEAEQERLAPASSPNVPQRTLPWLQGDDVQKIADEMAWDKGTPHRELHTEASGAFAAALQANKDLADRIGDIVEKNVHKLYNAVQKAYADIQKEFESGNLTEAQLRPEFVRRVQELAPRDVGAGRKGVAESPPAGEAPRQSRPETPSREPGNAELSKVGTHVIQRLNQAGIPITVMQARFGQLQGDFAKILGGSYNRVTKAITWALSDLSRPTSQDIRVLFEEVGHALFDRESNDAKIAALSAIEKLDRLTPEEFEQIKRDIAFAYPEGTPSPIAYHEELLMGWLTRKLQTEGFDPTASRGIAQSIVRMLKDLYLRASMWVQQTLLGQEYNNPDLALRYFQNRLEGFLAGSPDIGSWIERLGGGKAPRSTQLGWHTPVEGSRDSIESFNKLTQQIDTEPLVPDSVEAVMLNAGDDVRFSVPAPATPVPQYIDRATELNQQVAAINEIADLRNEAVSGTEITADAFRKLNGLKRTDPIKGMLNFEAGEKHLQNYKPDTRLPDFRIETNIVRAYRSAVAWVKKEIAKISDNTAQAKIEKPKIEALRNRLAEDYERIIDNYKDAGFMSNLIKTGFRKILYQDIRSLEKVGKALGTAFKQYQDIEGKIDKPIDPSAVNAMRKLYTGDALQGEKLFDVLDFMANDPGINFDDRASLIRSYIRDRAEQDPTLHLYNLLAADTPDAKALLSTVIAYGKLNRRAVNLLQVRKMAVGEERAALEQKLRDLRKETTEQITTGIASVAKTASIEEVAKLENRKALRYLTRLNRAVENNDRLIAANEQALPVYHKRLDTLGAKIELTRDTEYEDGMTVMLPQSNEAKPKWEGKEIVLNSARGQVTTSDEFLAMANRLAEWTGLRELAALNGDASALGPDYRNAKRQLNELVKNRFFDHVLQKNQAFATQLVLSPAPKRFEALGTPSSGLLGRLVNQWVTDTKNWLNESDKLFGFHNSRLERNLLGILNDGRRRQDKVTSQWMTRYLLNKAVAFMDDQQYTEGGNQAQELAAAYVKLQDYLMRHDHIKTVIGDRLPRFMEAFKAYDESLDRSDAYWFQKLKAAGELVQDRKLKDELRSGYRTGMRTRARKFSDLYFNVVHAMRDAGWEGNGKDNLGIFGDVAKVSEAYTNGGPQAVHALMDKYYASAQHGDTIQQDFLFNITHTQKDSVIETPPLDDSGTTMTADPAEVARAYDDAGGDFVGMFERLHDFYNGQNSRGDYIQEGLTNLASVFKEMSSALRKVEPKGNAEVQTLSGMIPNIMINSREFEHWPGDWFEYHKFDRNDNARIAERVSGTINFGREGSTLNNVHQTVKAEVDSMVGKLNAALDQAERFVPSGRKKQIEAQAAKILAKDTSPMLAKFKTGEDRLKYLRQVEKGSSYVQQFVRDMTTYFDRGAQETGSLRWGIRFAQELASLLVNQPGSAISQLATMFDIPVQWGASPTMLKTTARATQMTAKDIAGSLAQGIGWEFLKTSYYEDRFLKLNLNDAEVARRMGDIFSTMTGEENNPRARAWRIARDIQSATLNLKGEAAKYTPLRPGAPFFQFVNSSNRALFVALSELADGYVSKGIEYLKRNPGAREITAEDLGLKGLEKNSFELWRKDHARYGIDYVQTVKGALDRMNTGDRTVLTDKELARINAVALNAISLESNIATMPVWAFNNNIVRFGLPLLGWSYRRALQVVERIGTPALRGLRNLDKEQLKNVGLASLGLAITGLGGLGLSLVVDAYQEDVLGKKRNIRNLRVPTTGQDWIAINERLNRVGTFGLWGDFINGAVNVGTGQGDNRMLSVDQRVVAMQAFSSLQKAISNLINEDFDPNYRDVVRPAISALGGAGVLQYAQIINHAFDLDNVESRVVKRINAENYLRVTGRDLGMSIRTGGGGYNTPTPITPWIARMEYAAYANDPEDFRAAYRGAIEKAKEAGKSDAVDYIKRAFETRHPLRYVFAQVPSEREYQQVLANMDDRGQESVTEAVRLFNHYGQAIGLTPFNGSAKKDRPKSPDAVARAMERALTGAF